jgi:hypothetical protein
MTGGDQGVPGFHEPELRVRQGAGEIAALLGQPGTVVYDDRGLRNASQLTGQVEVPLAGEDIARCLLADRRRPSEEASADSA